MQFKYLFTTLTIVTLLHYLVYVNLIDTTIIKPTPKNDLAKKIKLHKVKLQETPKVVKKVVKKEPIKKEIIKKKVIKKKIIKKPKKALPKKVKKIIKKKVVKKTPKAIPQKEVIKKEILKSKPIVKKAIIKDIPKKVLKPVQTVNNDKIKNKYFAKVSQTIKENLIYPRRAKRMNIQGIVKVSFTIAKDGKITNIKVLESSNRLLNKGATKTLNNIQFTKIPADLNQNTIDITVPIKFTLLN